MRRETRLELIEGEVVMKPKPRSASTTRKELVTDGDWYASKRKMLSADERMLKK